MLLVEQLLMGGPVGPVVIPPQNLFMWGARDFYGQISSATGPIWRLPTQIGALPGYTEVDATRSASFVIVSGQLYSCGSGLLGHGDGTSRSSFTQVGALNNWSKVFASESRAFAIKTDGTLWAWGSNLYGTLGLNNNFSNFLSPVQVGTSSWLQVGTDREVTLAIKTDGTLWGWGLNTEGKLGLNDSNLTGLAYSSPVQIGSDTGWSKLSKHNHGSADGFYQVGIYSLALKGDGSLYSWGNGFYGSLGINVGGLGSNRSSPTQVGTTSDSWTQITSAVGGVLAIRANGTLWAWGRNIVGQLGLNDTMDRSSPVQVGTSSWLQVSATRNYVLAIDINSRLYTWGENDQGQGGTITFNYRSSPIQIGTSSWSLVSAGADHSLGITTTGGLFTWGYNRDGPLGIGSNVNSSLRSSPVQIGTTVWKSVATNGLATSAIRSNDTLWGWGYVFHLGTNNIPSNTHLVSSPVQIGTSSWTQVSVGFESGLAIRNGGSLFVWGINSFGQLGLNDIGSRSSPTQIGSSSWSQITSGSYGYSAYAIRADGALFGWGLGSDGQLGDNSIVTRSSPVQVGTSSWSQVTAGPRWAMAIRTDGTLWAWGENSYGQLGNNTVSNRSSPVQVGTSSWTKIACSRFHALAIRSDGIMFTWGRQMDGQGRSSPVQLGTSSWSQVAAGADISLGYLYYMAINFNGTLWAWGSNNLGQIGNSTSFSSSSPIQVGALNTWRGIALPQTDFYVHGAAAAALRT
jgi:alpha-tubulin suppressor-like RCC1 family protein